MEVSKINRAVRRRAPAWAAQCSLHQIFENPSAGSHESRQVYFTLSMATMFRDMFADLAVPAPTSPTFFCTLERFVTNVLHGFNYYDCHTHVSYNTLSGYVGDVA